MAPLVINRSLQDDAFSNWRLGFEFIQSKTSAPLPQPLAVADTANVNDYLHTRASVLHNHLHVCNGRVYLFVRGEGGVVSLCEALPCPTASPPFLLKQLTGDLRLVQVAADGSVVQGSVGAPVFPLREQTPLVGVRPFKLEAASWVAPGTLRCALWSIRTKTAQHPPACEIYLTTLSTTPTTPTTSTTSITTATPLVADVQLMACSGLPPHCVMCDPVSDAVLLACDPNDLEVMPDACQQQQPTAAIPATAAAAAQTATPQHNGTGVAMQGLSSGAGLGAGMAAAGAGVSLGGGGVGSQQQQGSTAATDMETDEVEHIECRPPGNRDDDDDDDMSPRTLAAAAARLAQYTSEEPQGNLPPQQWADIYKEAGPEDMVADSGCEMILWRAGAQGAGGAADQGTWRVACGAHKVLSSDTPGLLAVTDDVDACVLTLGWRAEGGEGPLQGRRQPHVEHVSTVHALAYVAAGKTLKKHLLFGVPASLSPDSPCSAVLVESSKFFYVYGQVQGRQHYGYQQVVDMELGGDERVMGARLLQGQPWVQQGKRQAVLLILTQRRLLACVLGA